MAFKNIDIRVKLEVMKECAQNGFDSLSTKRIAQKLKVSEPTLYAHFHTKDNLLLETFAEAWSQLPHFLVLPPSYEEADNFFPLYKEKIQEAIDNPIPVTYITNYLISDYYSRSKKEADSIQKVYREEVKEGIHKLNPSLDQNHLLSLVDQFILNAVTHIYYIVHHLPLEERDEFIHFMYRVRFFGILNVIKYE